MADSYFGDSSRFSKENGDNVGKIFVGGLSFDTTVEDLRQHFEKYGSISDCIVSMDRFSGRSKGFGFVTFDNASVIDQVLNDEHSLQGRNIEPQRAKGRSGGSGGPQRTGSKKLYLGNLDASLSESDINDHFSAFGSVVKVFLPTDRDTGERRPFGFVEYHTEDEADAAVAASNHSINGIEVDVQKARADNSRGDRGGRGGYRGGRGRGGGGFGGRQGGRGYDDHDRRF